MSTIDYPHMIHKQFDITLSAYHVFLNSTPRVKQGLGLLSLLRRLHYGPFPNSYLGREMETNASYYPLTSL